MMDGAAPAQARPAAAAAPAPGKRRFGAVNWLGLRTLYFKEVRRFVKVVFQTVFAPVISTALFLVVFLQAFGRDGAFVNETPYVAFLAPGLVMLAVMTNAFANSSSSLVIGKVQGSIVDVLMPPLSPAELTAAYVAGAATRGLLVGAITACTGAAFVAMSPDGLTAPAAPLAAIYFAVAAAVLFGALGVVGGIWAEKFDQLAAVTNFVITPLTFLSGTFYAIGDLPEPFLTASRFNPVFYLIDGFRYGFTGRAEADPALGATVVFALSLAAVGASYAMFRAGYKLKS
ncbi:MAG: ABC transporter permease [Pseudomonadota bacterium]